MPLSHQLVVLGFTPTSVSFLNTLVVYGPFLISSVLITLCIYLLLRFLLSDRCSNLFNMVVIFPVVLQDAYLHIPIVKHHHNFYALFGTIIHINGRCCLLGWLWSLGFSAASGNPYCSFAIARVFVLLFM